MLLYLPADNAEAAEVYLDGETQFLVDFHVGGTSKKHSLVQFLVFFYD
jgi:hypothetical protein